MRFEGNSRGINRSDYEEFSQFLGMTQPRFQREARVPQPEKRAEAERPVGMVYGVEQKFYRLYEPELSLENGTIFEELNKPFYPTGCKSKNGEGCL